MWCLVGKGGKKNSNTRYEMKVILPPSPPSFLPGRVLFRAVCQSPAASHLVWGRGSLSWALWTPSSPPAWPSRLEPAAWAAHGEGRWGSIFLGVSLWRVAWLPCPWARRRSVRSSRRVGGGMVIALPTGWTSTAELSVAAGKMLRDRWLYRQFLSHVSKEMCLLLKLYIAIEIYPKSSVYLTSAWCHVKFLQVLTNHES